MQVAQLLDAFAFAPYIEVIKARLLSVLHQSGATTLDGASYTYDAAGNRTSKTNYLNSITENYTYDAIYQLLQVTQGSSTTESYTYDAVGNRLSSVGVSPYTYNSSNELTSTPSGSYTYDANGNTLTDAQGRSYTWDFENRLSSVTLSGSGRTVSFKYDPFGRRIQKSSSSGTINYIYDEDDENLLEQVNNNGIMLARYTQGLDTDELLADLISGTTSFYDADGLGSITSLSNGSTISSAYTYNSFGSLTASSGTLANPFRYTGREFDSEIGIYQYRARYYDANVGRFINEDPLGIRDNIDKYIYVKNSPTTSTDPFGEYQLQGFPTSLQSEMIFAIQEARRKLLDSCCAGSDGPKIANAISNATFKYNAQDCGTTGPMTFLQIRHTISIGPNAFLNICCSLASTIVHEAVHSLSHFDDKAYGIEQKCFGCSDPRKQ